MMHVIDKNQARKQRGFTIIAILFLTIPLVILTTYFLLSTYQSPKQNLPLSFKSPPPSTPTSFVSPVTAFVQPTPKEPANLKSSKRTTYNFSEIWNGRKQTFEDREKGLLFYYPEIAQTYHYPPDTNIESAKAYEFTDVFIVDVVSQSQEGTELYDGMRISLAFTPNQNSLSLNQLVEKVTPSQKAADTPLRFSQPVNLNGYPAHKIVISGWGGGYTSYYLLNKTGSFFIRFSVISVGPEEEKFKVLSEEILNTIKLL